MVRHKYLLARWPSSQLNSLFSITTLYDFSEEVLTFFDFAALPPFTAVAAEGFSRLSFREVGKDYNTSQ